MSKITAIVVLAMLMISFVNAQAGQSQAATTSPATRPAKLRKDVSVDEFAKLYDEKKYVVLDVRSAKEFAANRIPGAVNLDVNATDFEQRVKELDKDQVYLVHCAAGVRSVRACDKMEKLQFTHLYNLEGGFEAWRHANKPQEAGDSGTKKKDAPEKSTPEKSPSTTRVKFDPATKAATTPGQHKFVEAVKIQRDDKSWKMSYLVHLPDGYDKATERKPMYIYLCGNTHQGSDLMGMINEGPGKELNDRPNLKAYWPFIALFPQPPAGTRWDTPGMSDAVVAIVDEVVRQYHVDPDRVYLHGDSMGGKGAWLVAESAPDRFAALCVMSGVAVEPATAGQTLKRLPTWIVCGSDDGDFTNGSKQMYKSLKAATANVQLTVVPNAGHNVCDRYFPEPKFYDWFMQFKREGKK